MDYEENVNQYLPTVGLLTVSTKIESTLEYLGGKGSGIWEKADSISNLLPNGYIERIIQIAEIRNSAVHGSPKINNFEKVMKEANEILNLVELKAKAAQIDINVSKLLEQYLKYDTIESLPDVFDIWMNDIKKIIKDKNFNMERAENTLSQEEKMFEILYKYTCYHAQRNLLKALSIFTIVSITFVTAYVLLKV